jgi:hypothetical protein
MSASALPSPTVASSPKFSDSDSQAETNVEGVTPLPIQKLVDPDLVEWDGPNDPENPQNFPFLKKVGLTDIIIGMTVNV